MTQHFSQLEDCIQALVARRSPHLIVGAPLGLGKPNALINALWDQALADRSITLDLFTALSLQVPEGKSLLERRFLAPFVDRHFGPDYPKLHYIDAVLSDQLPANITVSEFYMQSGKFLRSRTAQRNYTSSNYTHVARDLANRGVNVLTVMISARETDQGTAYSLSSNPDITLDLITRLGEQGRDSVTVVGMVNRQMPFMTGLAEVDASFFDMILENPELEHKPFAVPRQPIDATDYMIGLYASTTVVDGGTLQVGIGSLGDAFVYATEIRHRDPEHYRQLLDATHISARFDRELTAIAGGVDALGGFAEGLYAASEMFTEGFIHLYQSGILKRRVYPDLTIQRLLNARRIESRIRLDTLDALLEARALTRRLDEVELAWLVETGVFREGTTLEGDRIHAADGTLVGNDLGNDKHRAAIAAHCLGTHLKGGAVLHAAFLLGSSDFYHWLRELDEPSRSLFQMTGVGQINELYGSEARDRVQRVKARFINTTMKVSLTGAACSDGLEHHQVVSGVGGQYNFVAMAHALADSRSILMLRSTRSTASGTISNIVWQYPYETIPRHLRDLVITEYGIADLRGQSDEDCIKALLCITDSRFQESLLATAREHGKIDPDWRIPEAHRHNSPEALAASLKPWQLEGLFPDYPYGCDFDATELSLIKALGWLRNRTASLPGKLALVASTLLIKPTESERPHLQRMQLDQPRNRSERLYRRLLIKALRETR